MVVNQEKIFYTKVHALVGIAIGVTALTCLCLLPHQTIIIEETITKFIIISFTGITLFLAGAMIFLPDSSILKLLLFMGHSVVSGLLFILMITLSTQKMVKALILSILLFIIMDLIGIMIRKYKGLIVLFGIQSIFLFTLCFIIKSPAVVNTVLTAILFIIIVDNQEIKKNKLIDIAIRLYLAISLMVYLFFIIII